MISKQRFSRAHASLTGWGGALALGVLVLGNAPMAFAKVAAVKTVELGTASDFVILSESGITTTGTTKITGEIGVSPIASTAITGFNLKLDKSGKFSKSTLVSGKVYAADYKAPTPTMLTAAIGDMQDAYTDAAGRQNPTATELGSGNIGGLTIEPGLYKWSADPNVTIQTNVTLSGAANKIWIFQIAGTLNISSGKQVILKGGAKAKNIFWQVAGATTLGTGAVFNGNILAQTNIAIMTGAKLNGRALAQTAVTLQGNSVTLGIAADPITQSSSLTDSADSPCGGMPACSALSE